LKYIDNEGKEKQPVMLHRVILGSLERFIGALLEHYAGALPLWLSPEQVRIIPIKSAQEQFAQVLYQRFIRARLRAQIDSRGETLQKRIREAEMERIPYILVVGQREADSGKVAVRKRSAGDQGQVDLEEFIARIQGEIETKQ